MTIRHLIFCSGAVIALSACAADQTPASPITVRSVFQGQYCGDESKGVRWISGTEFTRIARGPAPTHLGAPPAQVPVVAEDERLLLVSQGQQGSGGYGVALADTRPEVNNDVLTLRMDTQVPAPDTMQTMQLTRPCLVVALPMAGYREVHAGEFGKITIPD